MIDVRVFYDNYWIATQLATAARELAGGDIAKLAAVEMGEVAQDIAWKETPFVTGSWASSWAVIVQGDETFLGIAPTATNPSSDENPPEYGPKVHAMGGISDSGHRRDVLNVLVSQHGEEIAAAGGESVIVSLRAVFA